MNKSTTTLTLGDFADRSAQIIRNLHESQEPVVITDQGQPAAVLVRPEDFDRFSEYSRFMTAVQEGLDDVAAGKVIDDEDLTTILEDEFGPLTAL